MMNKKNLRRVSIVVTAQTLHHLNHLAAVNGWGEKDIGRVIDKLMRSWQIERRDGIYHERTGDQY